MQLSEFEASQKAMEYVADMELIDQDLGMAEWRGQANVSIESIRHDKERGVWVIGIGFVRDWGRIRVPGGLAHALSGRSSIDVRTIKTVELDDTSGALVGYR